MRGRRASATTSRRWKPTIRTAQKRDYPTRVLAYEAAMEQVYRRYPDDAEGALFYALAINEAVTVLPADKSYARPLKAGQILERVLAAQPEHPGALHYLIHSYDFPSLAARGLPAAERYADVAPSAPHALHMPSHVFSMLGMWQESIRSNQASLRVAKTYVHAMDFMVYAYLQGAQDREAQRLVEESSGAAGDAGPAGRATARPGQSWAFTRPLRQSRLAMRLKGAGGLKRERSDSGLRIPPLTRSRISLARWAPREAATWPAREKRSNNCRHSAPH